jgi:hypothetical protein
MYVVCRIRVSLILFSFSLFVLLLFVSVICFTLLLFLTHSEFARDSFCLFLLFPIHIELSCFVLFVFVCY